MVLAASTLVGADASGVPAAENESGRAAPSAKAASPPAASEPVGRDARKRDPDQDVIDHLEQLEQLELLQHLELFDTAAKKK